MEPVCTITRSTWQVGIPMRWLFLLTTATALLAAAPVLGQGEAEPDQVLLPGARGRATPRADATPPDVEVDGEDEPEAAEIGPTEEETPPEEKAKTEDEQVLLPGVLAFPTAFELGDRVRLYWSQGVHLDAKHFQLLLGGRIQVDAGVLGPSGGLQDAIGLSSTYTDAAVRRGRLRFVGVVLEHYYLQFQYDFAQKAFNDVLVGVKNLRFVERLQLGNQKEPFSLEFMASSNDVTFMERGLPEAFVPGRNSGLRIDGSYLDGRLDISGGMFANTAAVESFRDAFASDTGSGFNLTVRLSGLPWYENGGRRLLLLGFAYSHQFRDDEDLAYQSQPESFLAPVLADTGNLKSNGADLINPVVALVNGPFSAQAEYVGSFVSAAEGGKLNFGGLYVFASYFLTGEHRRFNTRWAQFVRIIPRRNFVFIGDGSGAWEVAARYSCLDLDSGSVDGGVLNDFTFGINWYLNPNVRITGNYIFSDLRSVGYINIGQIRFQVAF